MALALTFALLVLGSTAVFAAQALEPQEVLAAAETSQEEVPLPDALVDPTFLSHNDPPACSGPYAGQICYQWSLSACNPPGSGICLCSQWTIVNGQFQCASGVCDSA